MKFENSKGTKKVSTGIDYSISLPKFDPPQPPKVEYTDNKAMSKTVQNVCGSFELRDASAILHPKSNNVAGMYLPGPILAELVSQVEHALGPVLATNYKFEGSELLINGGIFELQMGTQAMSALSKAIESHLDRLATARAHELAELLPYDGGTYSGGKDYNTLRKLCRLELDGKLEINIIRGSNESNSNDEGGEPTNA